MARFDLTDAEWAVIEALLPTDVRGKERADRNRYAFFTIAGTVPTHAEFWTT